MERERERCTIGICIGHFGDYYSHAQFVDLNRQEVTKGEEEEEAEVSCVDGDEGGSIRRDMKASEYTSI